METLVLNKASEKQQRGALKSFGNVANIFGANAEIEPTNSRRALEEQACALQVEITSENGDWIKATCSATVMKDLWSKDLAYGDLKTLDLIETFGNKTVLNPDTNLYEKVLDENGNPVKERLLTLGYAGTDTSALKLKITADDIAKAETSKRSVNWESLISI